MLQIALAGLVLNKCISSKEADKVFEVLRGETVPQTVTECVNRIEEILKDIRQNDK